jgi:two-component system, OmpR family, response regulator VicR
VKILLLEDNDLLNQAYKMILEKQGHKIEAGFNGEEGLAILKKFGPDLILLDMLMPKMSGLEFLKAYNKKPNDKVKIVLLTNLGNQREVEEALSLGADDYFMKAHMSPTELIDVIKKFEKKD